MNHEELAEILMGFDALVYAVGPDDRIQPDGPAYDFYHEKLVLTTQKVCNAAREAGITRCVILNSYFSYFDRTFPKKKLAKNHPYIKCRIEQAEYAINTGKDELDVMILELPYIFGVMPESVRPPLWKEIFIDRFENWKFIIFPKGGSTMISVEHVAEAIADALENGEGSQRYPIGDENITWKEMLEIMFLAYGKEKKVISIPKWMFMIVGLMRRWKLKQKKKDEGLHSFYLFKDILTDYFYLKDLEPCEKLQYSTGGVRDSIIATIKACKNFD